MSQKHDTTEIDLTKIALKIADYELVAQIIVDWLFETHQTMCGRGLVRWHLQKKGIDLKSYLTLHELIHDVLNNPDWDIAYRAYMERGKALQDE
jgi:hypothetical protein